MRPGSDTGLTLRSDPSLPPGELAIHRAQWRATLLLAVRPITAVLSVLGLATVILLMEYRHLLVPMMGLSVLLVVSADS